MPLAGGDWIHPACLVAAEHRVVETLQHFHQANPKRHGIEWDALADAVRLAGPAGERAITTTLETLTYAGEGGVDEHRSLITIGIPGGLDVPLGPEPETYAVTIDATLVSTTGRPFDQDPTTAALDSFVSRFQVAGSVGGGGHPCDACTAGYLCNDDETGCIPALDCASGCQAGFVCDAPTGQCLEDCRLYGACAAPGAACDRTTGRCQ